MTNTNNIVEVQLLYTPVMNNKTVLLEWILFQKQQVLLFLITYVAAFALF